MRLPGWFAAAATGFLLVHGVSVALAQENAPRRGWLGFTYVASEQEGNEPTVTIANVYPGSPAEAAGVREGDRVVRWNGTSDVGDALESLRLEPGDTVRLRLRRGEGRNFDVVVVAGSRPPGLAAAPKKPQRPFALPEEEMDRVREEWRRAQDELARLWEPGGPLSPEERQRLQEQLGKKQEELARRFREYSRMRGFRNDSLAVFWREQLDADSLALYADSLQKELRFRLRTQLGPELRGLQDQVIVVGPEGTSRAVIALGHRSVAGAEFEEMNEGLSSYFGTDDGLLVLRVAEDTPANRAGLRAGDVVLSAAGRPVHSIGDLRSAVAGAEGERKRTVPLEVLREGDRRDLQLRWE